MSLERCRVYDQKRKAEAMTVFHTQNSYAPILH